jgi:hypothetical protein
MSRARPGLGYHTVVLPWGGNATGRDFGNTKTVRISGTVFNDANKNGVKNLGEGGLANFTVYLDADNDGHLDAGEKKFVTGASGAYTFNALLAGFHHVRVVPKLFYSQTAQVRRRVPPVPAQRLDDEQPQLRREV